MAHQALQPLNGERPDEHKVLPGEPDCDLRRTLPHRRCRVTMPRGSSGILDDSVFVKEHQQWQEEQAAHADAASSAIPSRTSPSPTARVMGDSGIAATAMDSKGTVDNVMVGSGPPHQQVTGMHSNTISSSTCGGPQADVEDATTTSHQISVPSLVHQLSHTVSVGDTTLSAVNAARHASVWVDKGQSHASMTAPAPPAITSTTAGSRGITMSALSPIFVRDSAVASPLPTTPQNQEWARRFQQSLTSLMPQHEDRRHQHAAALLWSIGHQQQHNHRCEMGRLDAIVGALRQQLRARVPAVVAAVSHGGGIGATESTAPAIPAVLTQGMEAAVGQRRQEGQRTQCCKQATATATAPSMPSPSSLLRRHPLRVSTMLWGIIAAVVVLLLGRIWGGPPRLNVRPVPQLFSRAASISVSIQ